jgi:uncharacterized protein (DUF305 family)
MMTTRTIAIASAALATLLALAGCSSTGSIPGMDMGDESPSTSSQADSSYNDADVAFAMNMIAHHQQAIEMADTLLAKDGVDERVIELATGIKDAQAPEIETMTVWLEAWGQSSDMGGMNHGGMMTDDDMAALEAAAGPEASTLFLEQMTVHHQGAIDMAESEVADGQNADATALAAKIIGDQTAEIATMQELLATLR